MSRRLSPTDRFEFRINTGGLRFLNVGRCTSDADVATGSNLPNRVSFPEYAHGYMYGMCMCKASAQVCMFLC